MSGDASLVNGIILMTSCSGGNKSGKPDTESVQVVTRVRNPQGYYDLVYTDTYDIPKPQATPSGPNRSRISGHRLLGLAARYRPQPLLQEKKQGLPRSRDWFLGYHVVFMILAWDRVFS